MDRIQLKMPPDQVRLMADAIERDINANPLSTGPENLQPILTWLRYRLSIWAIKHPADPTA